MRYFETHIADHCNLRCKGCSHFSGLAKQHFKDLGEFKREFERLKELDNFGVIRLMGGEPLLNPDFMEYCRIARHNFPNSIICLVTNGLLADKLVPHINEIDDLGINVTVSDYHFDGQKIDIIKSIKNHSIHEKGQMYNIGLDLRGRSDPLSSFQACDLTQNEWVFFQDGRFYPCCIAGNINIFCEKFDINFGFEKEKCGIDIFTHNMDEINAFLKQPVPLCRFCKPETRCRSYSEFEFSKGYIDEWTCL